MHASLTSQNVQAAGDQSLVVAVEVPHEGEHCGHQHQQHPHSLKRRRQPAANT